VNVPIFGSQADFLRHWIFFIAATLVAVNGVLAIAIRESRPALALRHKIAAIVTDTGYSDLRAPDNASFPGMRDFARSTFSMPVRLFFNDPIVSVTAVMGATVVGSFSTDSHSIAC